MKDWFKTRWTTDENSVKIYPYRIFYILSGVLALAFAALIGIYMYYEHKTIFQSLPVIILALLAVALFWSNGHTCIHFDNAKGSVRKMLLGFIPVSRIDFVNLLNIDVVSNMAGGYHYRLFVKKAQFGKGIIVSSRYARNDDPNAVMLATTIIPIVHGFFEAYDIPAAKPAAAFAHYKYFSVQQGNYTVKKRKAVMLIIGFAMLTFGIHELTPNPWIDDASLLIKICMLLFFNVGGLMMIISAFTTITIMPATQTIRRKNPLGLGNRAWLFEDVIGIQTVRNSVNFIYSGTDIQMYFHVWNTGKREVLIINSLRKSANIERFVQETNQILEIPVSGDKRINISSNSHRTL